MDSVNDLITASLGYILKGAAQSETAKAIEDAALNNFWKWTKKFFVKEVPQLEQHPQSPEVKEKVQQQLQELVKNDDFARELSARVEALRQAEQMNAIKDSELNAGGDIRMGGAQTLTHNGTGDLVNGDKVTHNYYHKP